MDSAVLYKQALDVFPGGVNSPVRNFKAVGLKHPLFIERAYRANIVDTQGREYLDFVGSWGPMIHGHAHPDIVQAVQTVALKGLSFGAPTTYETKLAHLIKSFFPVIEKVRFTSSGTEATMTAVRLARGITQKPYVIKFSGCYHGHHDTLLVDAGSGCATCSHLTSNGILKQNAQYTLSLPFNDVESLVRCFKNYQGQISSVIIEPIAGNMGLIPSQKEFLVTLRRLCDKEGALLIFDEVMTGFRVARGGASEIYQIEPDMVTLGKIVGGGLPLGVVGSRASVMNSLAPTGSIYHAGTLSGNPCAVTAGIVTLELIDKDFHKRLGAKTGYLIDRIKHHLGSGVPLSAPFFPGMFSTFMTEQPPGDFKDVQALSTMRFAQFFQSLLKQGVYWPASLFEASFLSSAHTYEQLDFASKAIAKAIRESAGENQISD